MKKFLKKLTSTGIHPTDNLGHKRSILLINVISLCFFSLTAFIIIVRWFYFGTLFYTINFTFFLLSPALLFPIISNYFRWVRLSSFLTSFTPAVLIWSIFIDMAHKSESYNILLIDGLRFYIIGYSAVPYLILNRKQPILFVICLLPSFLSIVFTDQIMNIFVDTDNSSFINSEEHSLHTFRSFMCYLNIGLSLFILSNIASNVEMKINLLFIKLKDQNKILKKQQQFLNENNSLLEERVKERTHLINEQQKQILEYGFTNAHTVRGHVARILGLINLLKIEPDSTHPHYMNLIENETKNLDVIVKKISKELNDLPE